MRPTLVGLLLAVVCSTGCAGLHAAHPAAVARGLSSTPNAGARMIGIVFDAGLVVTEVERGGPADVAGLKPGDQITYVGFSSATDPLTAAGALLGKPGRKVRIEVLRAGRILYFSPRRRCLSELGCTAPG